MGQKVVLITAGTGDIGQACINSFLEEGYKVYYTYRSNPSLDQTNVKGLFYDATNEYEASEKVIKEIIDNEGQIDVLVNNLGKTNDKLVSRMSSEDFIDVINVNLVTMFNFSKAALKVMAKQKQGKIINISSIVGVTGNLGQANYSASKSAMYGMTKSMAKEYGRKNICINCISPGFIQTKMTDVLPENLKEEVLKSVSLKRFGQPEEIANLALFLGSDKANYITGQNIIIDGGMI